MNFLINRHTGRWRFEHDGTIVPWFAVLRDPLVVDAVRSIAAVLGYPMPEVDWFVGPDHWVAAFELSGQKVWPMISELHAEFPDRRLMCDGHAVWPDMGLAYRFRPRRLLDPRHSARLADAAEAGKVPAAFPQVDISRRLWRARGRSINSELRAGWRMEEQFERYRRNRMFRAVLPRENWVAPPPLMVPSGWKVPEVLGPYTPEMALRLSVMMGVPEPVLAISPDWNEVYGDLKVDTREVVSPAPFRAPFDVPDGRIARRNELVRREGMALFLPPAVPEKSPEEAKSGGAPHGHPSLYESVWFRTRDGNTVSKHRVSVDKKVRWLLRSARPRDRPARGKR